MDQRAYQLVTLAGLLHDLGKLVRAQQMDAQKSKPYGRATSAQGSHAADSVHFLVHVGGDQLDGWPLLADIIREHHRHGWQPENRALGQIVHRADVLSSRERVAEDQDSRARVQLESIFRQVKTIYAVPEPQFYRPERLEPSTAFPQPSAPNFVDFNGLVDGLETDMRTLFSRVRSVPHLTVALTELMAQYATITNTDKQTYPFDVSLFDHLSTTAAIAACLYLYHAGAEQWDDAQLLSDEDEKFLLVGCDLSGIQAYLYEIARIGGGGGVAKRLRARSFYLTALMDMIALRLRRELVSHLDATLPANCLLINAGGRFILLAPNLPEVRAQVARLDAAVNRWLREESHGDLACYFAAIRLRGQDFITEQRLIDNEENPPGASSITRRIDEVYQALNRQKQTRYASLLTGTQGGWQEVFVQRGPNVHYPPRDGDGGGGACHSCGKLPVDLHGARGPDAEETAGKLCGRCTEDLVLGRQLIEAGILAYRRGAPAAPADGALDLRFFGESDPYTLRVAAGAEQLDGFEPDLVEQLAVDPQCFDSPGAYEAHLEQARRDGYRYPLRRRRLASYVPAVNGEIVPFDQLAKQVGRADTGAVTGEENGEEVEPLIGILKMDVDQLGILISQGLGQVTSISRVATFSRMLDLFFSGWIDTKLRRPHLYTDDNELLVDGDGLPRPNPYRSIYTVYAGGDDLLLVGPWDRITVLARELEHDFRRYTNRNANLTVSAAVSVVKPRYPIARSAREAGRLLDELAKGDGRNRFHLFGVTVPWYPRSPAAVLSREEKEIVTKLDDSRGVFMDRIWEWAEFFDDQLLEHRRSVKARGPRYPISNILLHRILELSRMGARVREGRSAHIDDLTYMAQLAYVIGRNASEKRFRSYYGEQDYRAPYETVTGKLMELTNLSNMDLMSHMQLPLTWALYRNRQRSQ